MTIALATNCYNERLPILFVGSSKNPRCMKGEYPFLLFNLLYYNNTSSWVTKTIFSKYLNEVNLEMIKQNRKILLVMDNFRVI